LPQAKRGRDALSHSGPFQPLIGPVSGQLYTVQPKDTLAGIAIKFSMPLGVLMSVNRLFSPNVFGGQQLWVWKNPGNRTASSESVGSASPASSSSGPVVGSKSPAPNAAAALAVAAVAAGKANMRRTPSPPMAQPATTARSGGSAGPPPLERKASGEVRSPHEEAIAAFKNSMELDTGATLEEQVWWRLVGSKTPVVQQPVVLVHGGVAG